MQRLSNDQLAEKMRAANRRRSERQRAKRVEAGRAALTVWIPANLQKQIVELAAAESATTSDIAEQVLIAGLSALATRPTETVEATPAPESLPLFDPPLTGINADLNSTVEGGSVKGEPAAKPDYSERDRLIVQFRGEGLGYEAISKRLADMGLRAATGNPISKTTVKKVLKENGLLGDSAL